MTNKQTTSIENIISLSEIKTNFWPLCEYKDLRRARYHLWCQNILDIYIYWINLQTYANGKYTETMENTSTL